MRTLSIVLLAILFAVVLVLNRRPTPCYDFIGGKGLHVLVLNRCTGDVEVRIMPVDA